VNGPERQRRSGFNHITSSEDATYARAAHDWNLADTGRRKKAHVSRAHFAACRREPASPHGMAAGAFDAGAGNNRLQDAAGSIPSIRELIRRGDRIGTTRQPVPRVYEHAGGWRKIVVDHHPKGERIIDARADSLIGANGEPVDGRTVKRWQVDCRRHVMGQNSAHSMRDLDVFRRQRSHLAIDPG